MRTQQIDLVIAYVNNKDKVWRNAYIDYCEEHNCAEELKGIFGARYGGVNFLNYHLKLANKNMPWINNIYLLLSNKEQVDHRKLPKNVKVIYHNQFIPKQYLPTFNSCTIEMFLWNIPILSEHFIYANDDMLPTKPMKPSDFFDFDSGQIKISWRVSEFKGGNTYTYQCNNNCVALFRELGAKYNGTMIRPVHSYTPMIKSHCRNAFELLQFDIFRNIGAFRTKRQFNQYIYPIYEYLKYGTLVSPIDFLYTELDKDFDLNHQICCINCENNRQYVDKFITEIEKLCK